MDFTQRNKISLSGSPSWYVLAYLPLMLISYQGALNPYPLGMLDTASVFALLAGATYLIGGINVRLLNLVHWPIFIFSLLVTISSWYFFDYFQALFTAQILYLGADLFDGAKALRFEPYGPMAFGACILGVILSAIGLLKSRRTQAAPIINGLVGLALLGLGAAGLWTVEKSLQNYVQRGIQTLHPANLHPLHAVFKSATPTLAAPAAALQAFAAFKTLDQQANIEPKLASTATAAQPNVLIILLESFRADLTGAYTDGKSTLTPAFDQIAQESTLISDYYSNTTLTVSAELNIWCGIFDALGEHNYSYEPDNTMAISCLPEILANTGYESFYFHGNKSRFYNREEFIPKMGFDVGYFHGDQDQPYVSGHKVGWGIDDETMLKITLDQLASRTKTGPFFAHITTLSNHYPFHWDFPLQDVSAPFTNTDEGELFKNYQNAVFYTDYALGRFWEKFKQSPLYDNTVVIITSDHGIWNFDPQQTPSLFEKNERFYRAPLLIYQPMKRRAEKLNRIGSHIDLLPTILALSNAAEPPAQVMGKNLLSNTQKENKGWAIMTKGVDHILRRNDQLCFFNVDGCQTNQQNCSGWLGKIVLRKPDTPLVVCSTAAHNFSFNAPTMQTQTAALRNLFYDAKLAIQHSASTFTK